MHHDVAHHRQEVGDDEDQTGGDADYQHALPDRFRGFGCLHTFRLFLGLRHQVELPGPVHGRAGQPRSDAGVTAWDPALQEGLHLTEHAVEGGGDGTDDEHDTPTHKEQVHREDRQWPDDDRVGRSKERDRAHQEQPDGHAGDDERDERRHQPRSAVGDHVQEQQGTEDVQRRPEADVLHEPFPLGSGNAIVDQVDQPRQPFPDVVDVTLGHESDVLDVPAEAGNHREHRVAVGRRHGRTSCVSRHHVAMVHVERRLLGLREQGQELQCLGGHGKTLAVRERQMPGPGGLVDQLEATQLHDSAEHSQSPRGVASSGCIRDQGVDERLLGGFSGRSLDRHRATVCRNLPALRAWPAVRVECEHGLWQSVRVTSLVRFTALGATGSVDHATVCPRYERCALGDGARFEHCALGRAVQLGEQRRAHGRRIDGRAVEARVDAFEDLGHGPGGQPGEPSVGPDDTGQSQQHRLAQCLGHTGHQGHREREYVLRVLHLFGGDPRVDDCLADTIVHLIGDDAMEATANRVLPGTELVGVGICH